MQPVSLSAPSQLPQAPSFGDSLDNAMPHMQGQNLFGISRTLNQRETADLKIKIGGQQAQIGRISNHYSATYTPALNEAREIAPYISTKNSTNYNLFKYNTQDNRFIPALTYLVQEKTDGRREFFDLVNDNQQVNHPNNEFQSAKDSLDAINERLTQISAKETLKNRHVREVNEFSSEIKRLDKIIKSFSLKHVDRRDVSGAAFWHPRIHSGTPNNYTRYTREETAFPQYDDESNPGYPSQPNPLHTAPEASYQDAAPASIDALPPQTQKDIQLLEEYADGFTQKINSLDGSYFNNISSKELEDLRDNFLFISGNAHHIVTETPEAGDSVHNSASLLTAESVYHNKIVPALEDRGLST